MAAPTPPSSACKKLVAAAHEAAGPANVYNLYDNCPGAAAFPNDISALELKRLLRKRLLPGGGGGGGGDGGGDGEVVEVVEAVEVAEVVEVKAMGAEEEAEDSE